ncbi:MAG TPA: dihydroorotase [Deltaproteobacteria bacterium]|nr:dihydroorotase [Deltaproteobacteria bacterium]
MKREAYLIKQVRVFDPTLNLDRIVDVKLAEGRIAEIAASLGVSHDLQVVEGEGKILVPGFVDLHTHLREPGFEHKESIETGTRSAAAGGFTTLCCMANTDPVNDNAAITHYILEKARESASVRVLPVGAISKGLQGEELAEIGELREAGCVAISDDGMTVMNSALMRLAMDYAAGLKLPVFTHSIDANLSRGASMHEGEISCRLGLRGIPAEAEDIIVARDIYLSRLTGCRLHVAHVSTAGSVELIRQAKREGLPVSGEAAPHHFTLTDAACLEYDTHAKMCPPLRSAEHREAVIAGLADGTLDCIATDHAPHATVDKETEFDQAAFGILGFETALPLALRLLDQKRLTFDRLIGALTSAPLAVLKRPYTGIKVGAAADLTLLDLEKVWTYRAAEGFSKSRNSPFEGWEFKGKVLSTWVNGKRVHGHDISKK